MKQLLFPLALLGLGACATAVPYGPAATPSDYGYRDQVIESDRYRVSYRGKDLARADDGALRRAAELTVAAGDEWFQVVSRDLEQQGSRSSGPRVGVGGSTGGRVGVGVGVSVPLGGGGSGGGETTVRLEILTGSGPQPGGANVYDARSVLSNIG